MMMTFASLNELAAIGAIHIFKQLAAIRLATLYIMAALGQSTNFAVIIVLGALFVVDHCNTTIISRKEAHAIVRAAVRTSLGHGCD